MSSTPASWVLFASGAGAGVVEAVSVHPMDMIKTRQQLCTASVRPTILGTTRALLAEGGARRLYRGLFPEIIGIVPKSSAMYASYDLSRRALQPILGDTFASHGAAGFIAGFPEAVARATNLISENEF
ncbi:mitochondrial carrier domain-containing protein [Baffinella frigidus]|nr:mitochondrial carrier domain-containing protein [Cryptophyta sp. CCMP2293]